MAIKKLEEVLQVKLLERNASEITVTPLGEEIVRQAHSVLETLERSVCKDLFATQAESYILGGIDLRPV